jgi:hypothetical protein
LLSKYKERDVARKAESIESLKEKYEKVIAVADASNAPLACVIIRMGLIEKALITLLDSVFVECKESEEIFNNNSALGTFGSCMHVAYRIGLLADGMYQNLKTLAKIRNKFAHSDEFIDFDDAQVVAFCDNLKPPKGWILPIGGSEGAPVQGVPIETWLASQSAEKKFTYVSSASCMTLIDHASRQHHIAGHKDTWRQPSAD